MLNNVCIYRHTGICVRSRVIWCHMAPKEISNLRKYGGLGSSFL